jgi:AcrR family transcriptional regulator
MGLDAINPAGGCARGIRKQPTQSRALDKRQRILDTAQRLIHEEGYAATTVARVAREAGVAEATVYQMFSGRDAVLYALVERSSAFVDAANVEAVRSSAGKPWPELVRGLVNTFYRVSLEDPSVRSLHAAAQTVPALRELERDQIKRRAEQFAELAVNVAGLQPGPALVNTALVLTLAVAEAVRHALLCSEEEGAAIMNEIVSIAEARWRALGAR